MYENGPCVGMLACALSPDYGRALPAARLSGAVQDRQVEPPLHHGARGAAAIWAVGVGGHACHFKICTPWRSDPEPGDHDQKPGKAPHPRGSVGSPKTMMEPGLKQQRCKAWAHHHGHLVQGGLTVEQDEIPVLQVPLHLVPHLPEPGIVGAGHQAGSIWAAGSCRRQGLGFRVSALSWALSCDAEPLCSHVADSRQAGLQLSSFGL